MIRVKETATRLVLASNSDYELEKLANHFKFRPTHYWRAPSYERFKITGGEDGWDGYIRPLRVDYETLSGEIARGYKDDLLAFCKRKGFDLDTRGLLESPFRHLTLEDVPLDLLPGVTLDRYQQRGVHAWLVHGIGVCHVTVSGGKTVMFAAAARMIKREHPDQRILYITQSERLVRQAYTEMKRLLPGMHITRFGGGKKGKEKGDDNSGRDMVVATIAVINRNLARLVEKKWNCEFIAVFYDEVHHAATATSKKFVSMMPSYYRLGASDTKKEADPSKFNDILCNFGPTRSVTPVSPLIQMDRVARPRHYLVDVADWHNRFRDVPYRAEPGSEAVILDEGRWRKGTYLGPVYERNRKGELILKVVKELDEDGEWIDVEKPIIVPGVQEIELDGETSEVDSRWCLLDRAYDRAIIRFRPRNDLIAEWACYFSAERKFSTIVVCTRTLHIYILEAIIKQRHPEPELVEILFGWATSKQRDDMFDWFRQTPGSVLITPLVKEGVSINEIRAGVVADNVADWEVANQITGRFIRKKLDGGPNEAEIVWIIDRQHPNFRQNNVKVFQHLDRIHGYNFYHPVAGPDTIKDAVEFKTPDLPLP